MWRCVNGSHGAPVKFTQGVVLPIVFESTRTVLAVVKSVASLEDVARGRKRFVIAAWLDGVASVRPERLRCSAWHPDIYPRHWEVKSI